MCHRKEEHPSHKKCRYFIKGECMFSGEECWYLLEDNPSHNSNNDDEEVYKCFVCKNNFSSKHEMLDHKKKEHPSKVTCIKFQKGICDRSAESCRFNHTLSTTQANSTSPKPNAWTKPLSSVQKKDFPQPPPTAAPDQAALLEALNRLGQRLEAIENRIFPGLI